MPTSPLGKRSDRGIAKKSAALDKPSIVSLAQGSVHVDVRQEDGGPGSDGDDEGVPWHAVADAASLVEDLASSATQGLSTQEATRRLQVGGTTAVSACAGIWVGGAAARGAAQRLARRAWGEGASGSGQGAALMPAVQF